MKYFAKIVYVATLAIAIAAFMVSLSNDFWIEDYKPPEVVAIKIDEEDKYCMETALYFEIRNGTQAAMQNVADVILNRVETSGFPADVCSVVFQRKQFSAFNQGKPRKDWQSKVESQQDKEALELIKEVTKKTLTEGSQNKEILWYHTDKVKPSWSKKMKMVVADGFHRFFKKENSNG